MTGRRGDGKIGDAVPRREDLRLLRGRGRYSDDVNAEGQAYAVMVRSPHAHAYIRSIDSSAARAVPGVLAVLTGTDVIADGLKPVPHSPYPTAGMDIQLINRDGSQPPIKLPPILPADRARFAGEAVVMVVAETLGVAKDAAELVSIDYEPLASITRTPDAVGLNVPLLWDDLNSNVCMDSDVGDKAAADAAFARADLTVRLKTWVPRVTGVTMEPRAAVGSYDKAADKYTLLAGSGGVVRQKSELAIILGVAEDRVRVAAWDIGGNFGTRN